LKQGSEIGEYYAQLPSHDDFLKHKNPTFETYGDSTAVAYPFRMALGAEILKERLGLTDQELAEQISENPYLQ